MAAYYNEIDPFAAQWLRNLIVGGHIAPGDVDERSIRDVHPADLLGYTQCHFFAGIGVWSYVLRQAGWFDDTPVWTGSCPCQPFSVAGKRKGVKDDRHLWPDFYRLVAVHRPCVIFGEQVASRDGLAWLDFVCADLEAAGYAIGALDTCAAGFGAPHIRQRLFFVGSLDNAKCGRAERIAGDEGRQECETQGDGQDEGRGFLQVEHASSAGGVGNASGKGLAQQRGGRGTSSGQAGADAWQAAVGGGAPTNGFWADCDWLPCIDGKARAVEPGTFPLAHGTPNRVGRLRGYGNSLVAPQAAEFIRAYMSCYP